MDLGPSRNTLIPNTTAVRKYPSTERQTREMPHSHKIQTTPHGNTTDTVLEREGERDP